MVGLAALFIPLIPLGSHLRPNELIIGGGSCKGDELWVSSPSLYMRRDTPGVAVGMVQAPGKDRSYAYVLIIKGDEQRRGLAEYDTRSELAGTSGESRGFVEIAGKRAAFSYKVKVDPAGKQSPQERLSINGKALDLGKGRVVVVDLSPAGVSWKQVALDLPESPTWPTRSAQIESQAKKLLALWRRRGKEARSSLK
jgi:hypothetical protein